MDSSILWVENCGNRERRDGSGEQRFRINGGTEYERRRFVMEVVAKGGRTCPDIRANGNHGLTSSFVKLEREYPDALSTFVKRDIHSKKIMTNPKASSHTLSPIFGLPRNLNSEGGQRLKLTVSGTETAQRLADARRYEDLAKQFGGKVHEARQEPGAVTLTLDFPSKETTESYRGAVNSPAPRNAR